MSVVEGCNEDMQSTFRLFSSVCSSVMLQWLLEKVKCYMVQSIVVLDVACRSSDLELMKNTAGRSA